MKASFKGLHSGSGSRYDFSGVDHEGRQTFWRRNYYLSVYISTA